MKWNLPRNCHFLISERNGWPWDSRISGLFSFQSEQNKMNLTECNLLHARNMNFWISFSISFPRWRGKYNWHCIFSSLFRGSGWRCWNFSYQSNFRRFLTYQLKCQPISQRSVNLADLRSQLWILINSQLSFKTHSDSLFTI